MIRRPPKSPLFPSPPLSRPLVHDDAAVGRQARRFRERNGWPHADPGDHEAGGESLAVRENDVVPVDRFRDRKSTRLNSSHSQISYAVFCLKKKKKKTQH